MIRVVIVDDSAVFRIAIAAVLNQEPDVEVVGKAANGKEGVELIQRLRPDVVTMDVNMPVMTGYEAVEEVMASCPTPIVIVTASPGKQEREAVVKALALGALDVLPKPYVGRGAKANPAIAELVGKVKMLSKAHVIRHVAGSFKRRRQQVGHPPGAEGKEWCVVAIASSTGGPAALAKIFSALPEDLPACLLVAQHMAAGFSSTFVEWLASVSHCEVQEAKLGCSLRAGLALIAPAGRHLRVSTNGLPQILDLPPVNGGKPSGDILLTSVSQVFGARAIGVVLTGMGKDGTEGLRSIRDNGGVTVAQDEFTSVIFGMPKSAIEAGVAEQIAPLDTMAATIAELARQRAALR